MTMSVRASSSFRDPSGFLFKRDDVLFRQVNVCYRPHYDHLIQSGLYDSLVKNHFLIPHEDSDILLAMTEEAYKVIRPTPLSFISYPYEWCFSQLKDAALLTLEIQKKAMEFGMSLKDCSAYNIQFQHGQPILIDTLSFERYEKSSLWVGHRQFCQHFLAPLALMSYRDVRLNQLLRDFIDGIPLDLASSLLPFHTYLRYSLLMHIHAHARSQQYYADKNVKVAEQKMSRISLLGIIDQLLSIITKLTWKPQGTEWAKYYNKTNYSSQALHVKKNIVAEYLNRLQPKMVWDLGSNLGLFSRIASQRNINTIAFDFDPAAVEQNYLECKREKDSHLLPLLLNLTNPSPAIGWQNKERLSLIQRRSADTIMALALVHHLVFSNNLPLKKIADFCNEIGHSLIIEFIPKCDTQVQRLLLNRKDIFPDYTRSAFEKEFSRFFSIIDSKPIADSERILYLMEKR